ncbi:MAG: FkbM family methyltransferase [Bacteroidota bacterium]|jgi:FkbM family methyltransferase|nr:FkbM family methyltransferase [Terrimonas sp.]
MSKRLIPLIRAFGLSDGLRFFFKRIIKKAGCYRSSRYQSDIYIRDKFADKYTFKQVFLEDQYNFKFPLTPSTMLDGGANIGLASVYFAHRFPNTKIVAVEPNEENFKMILKNTVNYPNVFAKQGGIWNDNKRLAIIDKAAYDNSFMVTEVAENTSDSLPAFSIHSIMQEQGWSTLDVLKLDIEGSEKEVFEKNVEEWLPHTRMLIIEVHDNMRKGAAKSVFAAISKYDFTFSMHHENLVFINQNLTLRD